MTNISENNGYLVNQNTFEMCFFYEISIDVFWIVFDLEKCIVLCLYRNLEKINFFRFFVIFYVNGKWQSMPQKHIEWVHKSTSIIFSWRKQPSIELKFYFADTAPLLWLLIHVLCIRTPLVLVITLKKWCCILGYIMFVFSCIWPAKTFKHQRLWM